MMRPKVRLIHLGVAGRGKRLVSALCPSVGSGTGGDGFCVGYVYGTSASQ